MIRIVAYQPEIAQNLGNMIRTSAAFGVPISVVEPCGFPFSIKALRRSAMDYADIADISRHLDWENYCTDIPSRRILFTTKSDLPYTQFKFKKGDAIILGRESAGVPEEVTQSCHEWVTVPMQNGARSLNVSTTAAIGAAEALRQLGAMG